MKRMTRRTAIISAVAAMCLAQPQSALAELLYWDMNGETTGTGGAGTWDTASSFWRTGSSTGALQAWTNGGADQAYFGGTAGTVTLNGDSTNISLGGMTFSTTGYTIAAPAAGTTTLDFSGATPTITTNSAVTATIAAQIASGALIKDGAGALVLRGTNAYAGGTTLNAGTLHVNNASAIGTGKLTINGGTLTNTSKTSYTTLTLSTNNVQDWNGDFTYAGRSTTSPNDYNYSLNMGTGAVTLGGNRTVTITGYSSPNNYTNEGATLTIGGAIGDGGNGYRLTKSGNGTLRLNAANTFTGGVTLNAGTLQISDPAGLGTGTLTINGGALANTNASGTLTLSTNNPQVWSGNFTAAAAYTKSFNIGTGSVTLTNNITVTTASGTYGSALIVGGVIGDGGNNYGLTINAAGSNAGSVQLNGANTFSGGVTLNSGTLRIGHNNALGTGVLTINGGTVQQVGGTVISGVSSQTWNGDFSVPATSGALNFGTAPVTLVGARSMTVDNGSATFGNVISGATSSLTLKGTQWSGSFTLNGASTFGGGVTITPGTSALTVNLGSLGTGSGNSAIGTGTLRFYSTSTGAARIDNTSGAAGTLATNNAQAWDYNFTFIGTNDLDMGTGAVMLGGNRTVTVTAKTLTIGGAIDDGANSFGLTKAGAGTLVLTGANTYGGDTTITGGTLTLGSAGSLLLDINDGSNTAILGTGAVNLNGTLVLDVADVLANGSWTIIAPALTDTYGAGFGLRLAGSGTEFAAAGSVYSTNFNGQSWSFDRSSGSLTVLVPEPGAIAGVMCVVGLALSRRRRSH